LSHFLYGLILEQSMPDKAEAALVRLQNGAFDLNEIRVTTTAELAETMAGAFDPRQAAINVKKFLHSVFESHYSFELEGLKKQNLGKAQAELAKHVGATPFAISYLTQHTLGGHAIPLRQSAYDVLYIAGVIDEKEREARTAPGLERTIPKTKGIEFGVLLHQLALDFAAAPFSSRVRSILLEANPSAKERFPKRAAKKAPTPPPAATSEKKSAQRDEPAAVKTKATKKTAATPTKIPSKKAARMPAPAKAKPAKKPAQKK
jgi:endonuclease-3